MHQARPIRQVRGRWLAPAAAVVALCGATTASAEPFPPNPVDTLRQALREDRDLANNKEALEYHKKNPEQKTAAAHQLGDGATRRGARLVGSDCGSRLTPLQCRASRLEAFR
jgi:hypothetical protein